MQEARTLFGAVLRQLKKEAEEAIQSKHDEVVLDWFQDGRICFNRDCINQLPNYGFQQVSLHTQKASVVAV
jgi:hypothetical protein